MAKNNENKRNGISMRECVLGPGSVFLAAWMVVSLFRIGDPDAWSKIGRDFVILLPVWAVWCLILDYSRRHSWDLKARKRKHKRRMERLAGEKRKIGNYGWITVGISIMWVVMSAYNVIKGVITAAHDQTPYGFADFWGTEKYIFGICFSFWVVLAVINSIADSHGPDVHIRL